jgi:hypothetical protein
MATKVSSSSKRSIYYSYYRNYHFPLCIFDPFIAIVESSSFREGRKRRSRPGTGAAFGADISHRGGLPGFVRVQGDELTIPDFRGNRYFNTLGNLIAEPRASLLFIDFEKGRSAAASSLRTGLPYG